MGCRWAAEILLKLPWSSCTLPFAAMGCKGSKQLVEASRGLRGYGCDVQCSRVGSFLYQCTKLPRPAPLDFWNCISSVSMLQYSYSGPLVRERQKLRPRVLHHLHSFSAWQHDIVNYLCYAWSTNNPQDPTVGESVPAFSAALSGAEGGGRRGKG